MKQLIKDFLRALFLALPFKLFFQCFTHTITCSDMECIWCLVAIFGVLLLPVIMLFVVCFIYNIYIKPLWVWIWTDED